MDDITLKLCDECYLGFDTGELVIETEQCRWSVRIGPLIIKWGGGRTQHFHSGCYRERQERSAE